MANITRRRESSAWDPFRMMRELMHWDPFRAEQLDYGQDAGRYAPTFEVKENQDSYVFKADLPGVKQDDLDISLVSNRLTISGKREAEQRDEGETWYAYEREYGSFTRAFTLPEGVDPDHVRADLKDGVLTLLIPKKPEVQPKKIAVGVGEKKLKA